MPDLHDTAPAASPKQSCCGAVVGAAVGDGCVWWPRRICWTRGRTTSCRRSRLAGSAGRRGPTPRRDATGGAAAWRGDGGGGGAAAAARRCGAALAATAGRQRGGSNQSLRRVHAASRSAARIGRLLGLVLALKSWGAFQSYLRAGPNLCNQSLPPPLGQHVLATVAFERPLCLRLGHTAFSQTGRLVHRLASGPSQLQQIPHPCHVRETLVMDTLVHETLAMNTLAWPSPPAAGGWF